MRSLQMRVDVICCVPAVDDVGVVRGAVRLDLAVLGGGGLQRDQRLKSGLFHPSSLDHCGLVGFIVARLDAAPEFLDEREAFLGSALLFEGGHCFISLGFEALAEAVGVKVRH